MRGIFTVTLLLNSFLLFLIQPMAAKAILPRFGGAPAVWSSAMLCFQLLLLAGYAYAHFSVKWLGPRRQLILHFVLLALVLLTVPPVVRTWGISSWPIVLQVVASLMSGLGPIFFFLATGAPLLQKWFSFSGHTSATNPYFLYAASNVGSLVALLCYPVAVEPLMGLIQQSKTLSWCFCALGLMLAVCARSVWERLGPDRQEVSSAVVTPRQRLLWVSLSFAPSSLLLGVTNFLSTDLTPMPLIWIIPLALYLVTFILAFSDRLRLPLSALSRLAPVLVTPMALAIILEATQPLELIAPLHLITFFVVALAVHGRLSAERPDHAHLTEFYLWIAVGGALGGAFNTLAAPVIFPTTLEYPLAFVLCLALRSRPERHGAFVLRDLWFPIGVFALTVASVLVTGLLGLEAGQLRNAVVIAVPCIVGFFAVDRPLRHALALGALFIVSTIYQTTAGGQLEAVHRSFFGVHRVLIQGNFKVLLHGNTIHGRQDQRLANRLTPLTYYHPSGPMGSIFEEFLKRPRHNEVALIGMGVGSLASYGQSGQHFTFFEIDPAVIAIAKDPARFTFLRDSKATVDIRQGDGRLLLAGEADRRFNLIVLDAFSSDAIPLHLLTVEAMKAYVSKLADGGMIAFHISNRHLDLSSVLANVGHSSGLISYINDDPYGDRESGKTQSVWVLLVRSKDDLGGLSRQVVWQPLNPDPSKRIWTDDFSNVYSVMHL